MDGSGQDFPIQSLPEPIKGEVLWQVPSLGRIYICRRVCKEWKRIIDKKQLDYETQQVDDFFKKNPIQSKFTNEPTKFVVNAVIQQYHEFTMDDLLIWEKNKTEEKCAIKNDFFTWLGHYLDQNKNNKIQQRIESFFGQNFTTSLGVAMKYNSKACFHLLVNAGAPMPLKSAILNGHTEFAKKLIRAGAQTYEEIRFGDVITVYNALADAKALNNDELVRFIQDFNTRP